MSEESPPRQYTAISFAPVQGFIEKSRKLRDLYGASLILSFLSYKLVEKAKSLELEVISPGLPTVQEGMPNRILVKGKARFERNEVQKTLLTEWQKVLKTCREWVEDNLGIPKDQYYWSQTEEQVDSSDIPLARGARGVNGESVNPQYKRKQKGEWERWGSYTWEIFWGYGESVQAAMDDLETRKLKRDWTAINWTGESSSLTGTDAIAWHQLGKKSNQPWRTLTQQEQDEQELFYRRLSWLLDNPDYRVGKASLSLQELRDYEQSKPDDIGKYIAPNERLSIPELVKRLVTYDQIADDIKIEKLKKKKDDPEFKDIIRKAGYYTGWFMGDGDKVGDKLQHLASRYGNEEEKGDEQLKDFTDLMRKWGKDFQGNKQLFPQGKGRVIYAGGDDFLGVLYSEETKKDDLPEKVKPIEALQWLLTIENHWVNLQNNIKQELNLDFTFSVGFVWAGHQVPQRDILQHCREAEKRAKSLGRNRVTIRVVFNSGQYVQWTCPWDYLHVLKNYRDRDGKTWGEDPNWNHIYNDWAQLKARHAIRLKEKSDNVDDRIALALFDLYFSDKSSRTDKLKPINKDYLTDSENSQHIIRKDSSSVEFIEWIDGLINIGWQLCSNS
ncbi:MAG: CRISPR-associated protein Cmr2 [Symploca sp. SIO1C4]|uniref:CRISPR-associated protein Cmr2 n=1 Tax=Symploca sp. SIO1C4 TaxID=2607765 RepID=A0A6B3N3M0_9CYAN|nr:CRISPR-associated protein Cmr2 [Symploca sp. SIO1C4]